MAQPLAALCFALPADTAAGEAPTRLTLIPAADADGRIRGIDGRAWRMSQPAAVVAAFIRPRAITQNHAGQLAAHRGEASPAFGWIERVFEEAGALLGEVRWTPRGAAALAARDYRYLSPEFVHDPASGEIRALVGASLVNDPNFPQLALNGAQPEHPPMSLTAIAKALGLTDAADEAACLTAITTLRSERDTARNAAALPDTATWAPRAELTTALNRATTAEGELTTLKAAQAAQAVEQLLDQAQAEGRVIPATRGLYLALCQTQAGLAAFKAGLAAMPVIAAPSGLTAAAPAASATGHGLTELQLAICSRLGQTPEAYAAALKAAATA